MVEVSSLIFLRQARVLVTSGYRECENVLTALTLNCDCGVVQKLELKLNCSSLQPLLIEERIAKRTRTIHDCSSHYAKLRALSMLPVCVGFEPSAGHKSVRAHVLEDSRRLFERRDL